MQKVNSESDLLVKSHKKYILAEIQSRSMDPLITPGSKVPVKIMPLGTQYAVDDIIVFDRDGINIIHRIEYSFESNGKTYYVTEGVNPETNQYVDDSLVSEEDIIGIADLSDDAFARVQELYELGKAPIIEAYGMTQQTETSTRQTLITEFTNLDSFLKNVVDSHKNKIHETLEKKNREDFSLTTKSSIELLEIYSNRGEHMYYGIVYKITHKETGQFYIGVTIDPFAVRWTNHKRSASEQNPKKPFAQLLKYVNEDLNQDLDKAFKFEIIEICYSKEKLRDSERNLINEAWEHFPDLNLNKIKGGSGIKNIDIIGCVEAIARGLDEDQIRQEYRSIYLRHIEKIWGSLKEAQKIHLKPVIEQLIKKGYSESDIKRSFNINQGKFESWLENLWDTTDFNTIRNKIYQPSINYLSQ